MPDDRDAASLDGAKATIENIIAAAEKAVATIKEHLDVARNAASAAGDSQNAAASAASEANTKLGEITAVATKAVASRTEISDNQTVIATKSAHIQDAQEHADKVRADLDRALTSAMQQVTETEGLKSRVESASSQSGELLAALQTAKSSADADVTAIVAAREGAKEAMAKTKSLADRAENIDTRIAEYEKRLADLDSEAKAQLKTIVNLLPGATSAGLAHAFDQRRQTFLKPRTRWQLVFVAAVLALVAIAATGLWHVVSAPSALSYDELIRLWLARLPIAGALIWLALYASHESSLAKRLEEDYGYKAAIAASFEGFNKQMSEIASNAGPDTPLAKLCNDTLSTIGSPPGHIYEKHGPTPTPMSEVREMFGTLLDKVRGDKGKAT